MAYPSVDTLWRESRASGMYTAASSPASSQACSCPSFRSSVGPAAFRISLFWRVEAFRRWVRRVRVGPVFALIMTFSLLSGCSLAPKYQRPTLDLPETWKRAIDQSGVPNATVPLERAWWKRFQDPVLDQLVAQALQANLDIEAAAARVDAARAQLGLARAGLFPQVTGSAQSVPVWVDNKRVTSGAASPNSAGLSASWEIDLWGRLRNARDAALFQLQATDAAREGVLLSVAGQTAQGYFLLRGLDASQAIAERTLRSREEALTIYQARYEQGTISAYDLTSSQAEVESARTTLYGTIQSREAAESALALLTGRSPQAIFSGTMERGKAIEILPAPPVIPAGLPSDLLVRRPDIRQAEYSLQAANADIGAARAAWLPQLSLTGLLGIISPEFHTLLSSPLQTHSYGGSVSVPLLDFGRVQAGVESAEAASREAVATYGKTVQTAFQDVRDALTKQQESARIVTSTEKMVGYYREAASLARLRYDNGYSAYLEVLDAERSLFQAELNLASARSDRLSAVVAVCMALGGGWKE